MCARGDAREGKRKDRRLKSLTNVVESVTTIVEVRLGGNQFAERESETKMDEIEPKDLSKAEWKVMKIVWQERKALAREVYSVAGEEFGWTPATVKHFFAGWSTRAISRDPCWKWICLSTGAKRDQIAAIGCRYLAHQCHRWNHGTSPGPHGAKLQADFG